MKKIIILLFLSISLIGKAQDIPDSSKVTFNKVYSDVKEGLQGLSQGLKQGATHVYEVLINQQRIDAITYSFVFILFLILCIISWKIFIKGYKRTLDKEDSWYDSDFDSHFQLSGMLIMSVIFSLAMIIDLCATLTYILIGFFNPEYGAIKEIIDFVK